MPGTSARLASWARSLRPHGHRPALDGLRALAVLLVFLFHAFPERVPGGDIGVDIFFVLSGYLLTQVLVRQRAEGWQCVTNFWARRARRIIPALVLALLGTALIIVAAFPKQAQQAWAVEPLWAAGFAYNWYVVAEANTPELAAYGTSPYLPLWTLAVEEQFYLWWPLLFLGAAPLLGVVRRRIVGVLAVLSVLTVGLVAAGADWPWIHWSSLPRFAELALGGLLAVTLRVRGGALGDQRSRIGVVLLIGSLAGAILYALFAPSLEAWGHTAAIAFCAVVALGLVAGAESSKETALRPLTWTPVVLLGVLSYGIYLWQMPFLALVRTWLPGGTPSAGVAVSLAAAVLTVGTAALSFLLVESPIRRQNVSTPKKQGLLIGTLICALAAAAAASYLILR